MRGCLLLLTLLAGCDQVFGLADRPDAAPGAADAPSEMAMPIQWVQPFAQHDTPTAGGTTTNFVAQAADAGDAVVLLVGCLTGQEPTGLAVTAPGWTFRQLGIISGTGTVWAAVVGAIAPDTNPVTVTVSWVTPNCQEIVQLGDEFMNTDPAGGLMTFDANALTSGTGDCTAMVTTRNPGDAIWGGCYSTANLTSISEGYTKGADTGGGEWSAYKITTDPAGTVETVTFGNPVNAYNVMGAVALKQR
jgi:hypothetical protein